MPDGKDAAQSVTSWYPILKWNDLPNFSSCHNVTDYTLFIDYYYVCKKLSLLEDNITELIKSGNHTTSIRLMGAPGAGKTTFLYYLMKKAIYENGDVGGKCHFYIFHANKANDPENYDQLVMSRIFRAWKEYFTRCGYNPIIRGLESRQDLTLKEKLNWLADYYLGNKELFDKTLVFIIDDVDTLTNDMAMNIARSVRTHLELQSVIKWISIRNETYVSYPGNIKKFFTQFFPDVHKVPDVSLHDIINYRIESCSGGNGKKPFSVRLCDDIVSNLCDGNKREALPLLYSILANTLPKKITDSTSEEFIQNYLEKAAVNILVDKEHLPNLHLPILRNTQYPVAYDIMMCLMYTMSKKVLYASIKQIIAIKCKKSSRWKEGSVFDLKFSQFEHSLQKLEDQNLLSVDGDNIHLTKIGKVLQIYLTSEAYHAKCLEMIPGIDKNEGYEDFLALTANYENAVRTLISWQFEV